MSETGRTRSGPAIVPGLYRSDSLARFEADVTAIDQIIIRLDAAKTKTALMRIVAAAIAVPHAFGANWDALEDSLGDLSWRKPERPRRLLISGWQPLRRASRKDWSEFCGVLKASVSFWESREPVMQVVLEDADEELALPDFVPRTA